MAEKRPARFVPAPGFKQDLQELHDAAVHHPRGPEDRLLRVALNQLDGIMNGATSTHPLDFMPSYPDLSDCETTYVGADPNTKPAHRIVWREIPPEGDGGSVTREIIAFGQRANGHVYHLAGQRLGRPVGVTLAELSDQREPIADRSRTRQRTSGSSESYEPESDFQFE
jgi:hypothetical protein